MTLESLAIIILIALPLSFAALARLTGTLCQTQSPSIAALGLSTGAYLTLNNHWWVRYTDTTQIFATLGHLCAVTALLFSFIAASVLVIEIPTRWALERGSVERFVPWPLVRTLVILWALAGSLSWFGVYFDAML